MEPRNKVPVTDLSEQRWARIERRLFERVANGEAEREPRSRVEATPRFRMAAALVLAGAVAAIGGGAAFHALSGPGDVAHPVVPSRVATEGESSHVSVGEATLDVAPRSVVSVSGDDSNGVTVTLERGRVECEVPPRHGRPPFTVQAGDVAVRVVGTHFAVSRDASAVDVDVQRGVVAVTAHGQETAVHAGEQWPRAPVVDVAESSSPVIAAPGPSVAASGVAPPGPPEPAPSSVPPPTPRELYEAATRLEASRPDLAIAKYHALAAKGGPWGMNALFAQGRLESERGHVAEARQLLEEYLARYPSGPNAGDARQLLSRLR